MAPGAWFGKTIIVCDDSSIVQQELVELYRKIGLNPIGTALDGAEALHLIEADPPDLVSLDIIMPEMNGIECFRRIRDSGLAIRAFFVSCLSAESKVIEGLGGEIPAHLFLPKPPLEDELSMRLDWVMNLDQRVAPPVEGVAPDEPPPLPDVEPPMAS